MAARAALRRGPCPLGGISLSESSAAGASLRSAPLNPWLRPQQRHRGGREVHGQGIARLPYGPALLTGERGMRDALHPLRQSVGVRMASKAAPARLPPTREAQLEAQRIQRLPGSSSLRIEVGPLDTPPLQPGGALSCVTCSAHGSIAGGKEGGEDTCTHVRYFQPSESLQAPPTAVSFDSESGKVDIDTLLVVAGSKAPYVELLDSTQTLWVAFTGSVRGQVNFAGDGTASNPYIFRKPSVPSCSGRVALASPAMTSSYLRTEQRVDSCGSNVAMEEHLRLFYNHRPRTVAALPASLAYPGFGRFIDGLKSDAVTPTREDYTAAADLCRVGHCLFKTVDDHRDALNQALSRYLGKTIEPVDMEAGLHGGGTTTHQSGGSLVHNTKAGEYLLLNTEFKTEGGPVCFKNQWYYKAFWGRQSDSPLLQATVAPAFLIDQPGPLFRVVAAFFMGHLHAEPLTPAVNLLSLSRYNMDQMEYLARVLHNLKREVKALQAFVKEAATSGNTDTRSAYLSRSLPYPFFMQIEDRTSICQRIRDIQQPRFVSAAHRIWTGVLDTGEKVLIKFSQTYGKQVHKAWAKNGLAPKLFECRPLPGGFNAIVMEYLSEDDCWIPMTSFDDRQSVLPLVERKLWEAQAIDVDGLGGRGVLGDCRDQNVMLQCRKNALQSRTGPSAKDVVDVRFIDFDWAGVAGVQRYPPFMNTQQVNWPQGAETGRLIRLVDDMCFLRSGGVFK